MAPSKSPSNQERHHPYPRPKDTSRQEQTESRLPTSGIKVPPSPPRSRRDASETPSIGIGLGVAFGGSGGGKWWDDELPPPPASLTSILESFRRSGEGDRELLLSILGAKKAEEERLTALIQTRLSILQARLSLHSATAALSAPPIHALSPSTAFRVPHSQNIPHEIRATPHISISQPLQTSQPPHTSQSSNVSQPSHSPQSQHTQSNTSQITTTSQGTTIVNPISPSGSTTSSPPSLHTDPGNLFAAAYQNSDKSDKIHLPPPTAFRKETGDREWEKEKERERETLPPIRLSNREMGCCDDRPRQMGKNGLEMLLDAGLRRGEV
ncbi:hypothetical protein TREMEDRAFT_74383 [Tremella mesenterica DSM 1558]|uniref:uncharacterized protein n=1 Tax=Tremella mesenterica (strain ATCC 24925 / CBS 8224 / DSM 1558 / NBRC 9311 / NRRL Y-6157 / RJB 2259-6 / UBC 559-6) TaxID=578456 RepID=UPI0003F49749|nr:uncharacterized protein TREMEDRAFT_74383 [Tremella mesenterica DSM 1558]EIW68020.1 hypothetical protein TREMEDRAFT_74383 [Tremella mesenterica DSM 1558]